MNYKSIAEKYLGFSGRMICGSKGQYSYDNKDNLIVFNGNLLTKEDGKIWYGDLDITIDEELIKKIAIELGKKVYVLQEMDCRFETEKSPKLENAVYITDGVESWFLDGFERFEGKIKLIKKPESNKKEIQKQKDKEANEKYKEHDYDFLFEFKMSMIKKVNKDNSPVDRFFEIIKNMGIDDFNLIYVSESLENKLKQKTLKWMRKYHSKYATEYRIQSNFTWYWFDNSPCNFIGKPKWVKNNAVYLKKV